MKDPRCCPTVVPLATLGLYDYHDHRGPASTHPLVLPVGSLFASCASRKLVNAREWMLWIRSIRTCTHCLDPSFYCRAQKCTELIEQLGEVDDEIAEFFLNNARLAAAIRRVTISLKFSPIFPGSAIKNTAVQPLCLRTSRVRQSVRSLRTIRRSLRARATGGACSSGRLPCSFLIPSFHSPSNQSVLRYPTPLARSTASGKKTLLIPVAHFRHEESS
jgi:hypothetical protein